MADRIVLDPENEDSAVQLEDMDEDEDENEEAIAVERGRKGKIRPSHGTTANMRTIVATVAVFVVVAAIIVVDFFATRQSVVFVSAAAAVPFFYRPEWCGFDTAAGHTLTLGATHVPSHTASINNDTYLVPFLSGAWRDTANVSAGYMVAGVVACSSLPSSSSSCTTETLPFNGCGRAGPGMGTDADMAVPARVLSVHVADGTACFVASLMPVGIALHCMPSTRVDLVDRDVADVRRVLALLRGPTDDTLVLVLERVREGETTTSTTTASMVELRLLNRRGQRVQPPTSLPLPHGARTDMGALVFWGVARPPTGHLDTLYVATAMAAPAVGIHVYGTLNLGQTWSTRRDLSVRGRGDMRVVGLAVARALTASVSPRLVAAVTDVAYVSSSTTTTTTLVSARTCRGGADVRAGCNTSVVLAAACVPDPSALASACVRVRVPTSATLLTPLLSVARTAVVDAEALLPVGPGGGGGGDTHVCLEAIEQDGTITVNVLSHHPATTTASLARYRAVAADAADANSVLTAAGRQLVPAASWLVAASSVLRLATITPPADVEALLCRPGTNPRQTLCVPRLVSNPSTLDTTTTTTPVWLGPVPADRWA